jgi:hypothetical protein
MNMTAQLPNPPPALEQWTFHGTGISAMKMAAKGHQPIKGQHAR